MKLIVGLGNPGKEYTNTRHNIGFFMIDKYVEEKKLSSWKKKFNGLYLESNIDGEKVIFLKPQSFMNLSGGVVRKYVEFFKISIDDILIISDDLDLNIGNIKLKMNGSSGGHNGLKDIEKNLGTKEYKRLKIGISNNKQTNTKDYVLGKINREDIKIYEKLSTTVNAIIDDFLVFDYSILMNRYNRKNR